MRAVFGGGGLSSGTHLVFHRGRSIFFLDRGCQGKEEGKLKTGVCVWEGIKDSGMEEEAKLVFTTQKESQSGFQ